MGSRAPSGGPERGPSELQPVTYFQGDGAKDDAAVPQPPAVPPKPLAATSQATLSAPKITAVNYSAGGTDTAQERTVTPLFPGVTVPPSNQRVFHVAGTVVVPSGTVVVEVLARPGTGKVLGQQAITKADAQPQPWRIRVDLGGLPEGRQELVASVRGEGASAAVPSEPLKMNIRTGNPVVTGVEPLMLDFTDGPHRVLVRFDEAHQLAADRAGNVKNFGLVKNGATTPVTPDTPIIEPKTAEFDDRTNSVLLTFGKLDPGNYKVLVRAPDDAKTTFPGIKDVFGNPLAKDDDSHTVSKPAVETAPTVRPGVHGFTGPYVPYPEYTRPRKVPDGFNPADHVETRVCRLYYSRNAHRVAQIINRNVRSYNREAVDVSRQLADKSRMLADQFTDNRRAAEREAIEAARQSREAERKLQAAQQNLNTAARELPAAQQAAQDEAVILEADKEATAKDLAVKNAELEQATAAAKDARAAADKIPASDPSKDAAEKLAAAKEKAANEAAGRAAAAQKAADRPRPTPARDTVTTLQQVINNTARNVEEIQQEIQAKRAREFQASQATEALSAQEERARQDQFRRETAAAHEDPDTYAPGVPNSNDPVQQVSISVIGEGVIQLRGPLKGINIIRKMINEIDAPVGQVRVAIHTLQVNGEHGDRMEGIAGKIQRYLDQSRFLTSQSGEILRKAIVQVAAQRAQEAPADGLNSSQECRDRKYLRAFFGGEFIAELEAMDSEFLHTGNKVLSLHSMDSTSLPAALFLMALANNTTRQEILARFAEMAAGDLATAEMEYMSTAACPTKRHKFANCKCCDKLPLLACNARFTSLRGFFDVQIEDPHTMTPIQREVIRLAQIFKSRLITEMEVNQRVMERGVIEDRVGNYQEELKVAKKREDDANEELRKATIERIKLRTTARQAGAALRYRLRDISDLPFQLEQAAKASGELKFETDKIVRILLDRGKPPDDKTVIEVTLFGRTTPITVIKRGSHYELDIQDGQVRQTWNKVFQNARRVANDAHAAVGLLRFTTENDKASWNRADQNLRDLNTDTSSAASGITDNIRLLKATLENLLDLEEAAKKAVDAVERAITQFANDLERDDVPAAALKSDWIALEKIIHDRLQPQLPADIASPIDAVAKSMQALLTGEEDYAAKFKIAAESRRKLDHKKMLDLLLDDLEDKYVELLEGTRAHTANVDAYIKRLTTALEDDFNTQFYLPSFRAIREMGRKWDVQFGQIETTSILANNREFAKVEPQATMEFDLPKRDILINEAMNGAKAAVQDFGALVNDPTFIGLTQLKSGQPTANLGPNGSGGVASVRSVIPGLDSDTAEQVISQAGPAQPRLGTAMDALIPDPAVYKFETGTGYEIRPVIQPDGQSVVFHFLYMYTTNIREPVRPDEKHLGRVKRHFIDTDVQLGNYELREISRYQVALKASRTGRGVPLFEDLPAVGVLFRPLPQKESSLQENLIYGQTVVYPTLFDLMGLRWAPAVSDLDTLRLCNEEFTVRNRRRALMNRVYDYASTQVDEALRIPEANRRPDLYRVQETIPVTHPNGYQGPGLDYQDSKLREGYQPERVYPPTPYAPGSLEKGPPPMPQPSGETPSRPEIVPLPAPRGKSSSVVPSTRDRDTTVSEESASVPLVRRLRSNQ